jgi:hypothetical protein
MYKPAVGRLQQLNHWIIHARLSKLFQATLQKEFTNPTASPTHQYMLAQAHVQREDV